MMFFFATLQFIIFLFIFEFTLHAHRHKSPACVGGGEAFQLFFIPSESISMTIVQAEAQKHHTTENKSEIWQAITRGRSITLHSCRSSDSD